MTLLGPLLLSNIVYQSWLTERGIESPGGQPFEVLATFIPPLAEGLIVARSDHSNAVTERVQLEKLSKAFSVSGFSQFAWILFAGAADSWPLEPARSVMPALSRVLFLDDNHCGPGVVSFRTEKCVMASRPLEKFYGPSLATMNANPDIKSAFWSQARMWVG